MAAAIATVRTTMAAVPRYRDSGETGWCVRCSVPTPWRATVATIETGRHAYVVELPVCHGCRPKLREAMAKSS